MKIEKTKLNLRDMENVAYGRRPKKAFISVFLAMIFFMILALVALSQSNDIAKYASASLVGVIACALFYIKVRQWDREDRENAAILYAAYLRRCAVQDLDDDELEYMEKAAHNVAE